MEQILLAYVLPKETDTARMMFYKSTKVMVHSLDSSLDFFEMISRHFPEDTLALHLLINCQDYVLRTSIDMMKEKDFTL